MRLVDECGKVHKTFVPQLERASDEICKGESVDCREYYTVRRIDGKCNNLKNQETKNWGATAIGMRRLVSPAYGEPDKPDLHIPRQVLISEHFDSLENIESLLFRLM